MADIQYFVDGIQVNETGTVQYFVDGVQVNETVAATPATGIATFPSTFSDGTLEGIFRQSS